MLVPAAGPKGFGLAFVIDLLCGGLSGGAIGSEVRPLYGDRGRALSLRATLPRDRRRRFSGWRRISQKVNEQAQRVSGSKRAPGIDAGLCAGRTRACDAPLPMPAACTLSRQTLNSLIEAGKQRRHRNRKRFLERDRIMKKQITSSQTPPAERHFSQATAIAAKGTFVFISGMTARRAGRLDRRSRQCRGADPPGLRERQGGGRGSRRHARRYRPRRCLCPQHGAFRHHPQSAARIFQGAAPASTMVEVNKFTSPDYLIEINAIAVLPNG